MKNLFILLATTMVALSSAGTYTVEPAQWQGGSSPAIVGDPGEAGASLSGTTASWFAKFPNRFGTANDFNAVQVTVSWKIVWTPSFAGETPPTSAAVVVHAKGTIFAYVNALCPALGSVNSNVSVTDASLGIRKAKYKLTGKGEPNEPYTYMDGSEETEVTKDYIFSGQNAPPFTADGNGGAYAYIAVAINAAAVNTSTFTPGGYGYLQTRGGVNASMKPISVAGQPVG